jgi:predicted porin
MRIAKPRLTALCAAALGFLSGPALAQSSGVIIYGRAHLSVESLKSGARGVTNRSILMKNNTSRLGFRGEEDLGEGLKAFFQIEGGVALDDGNTAGSNTIAGRDSYVGLKGNWGAVKAGGYYHPYDDLHSVAGTHNQIYTGTTNDATLWANGSNSKTGGFDERLKNDVSYETPKIAGFTGKLWYSFIGGPGTKEGEADNAREAYAVSSSVMYENGPFKMAWGHLQQRSMSTFSKASAAAPGFYEDGYSNMLVAGYQFGPLYVGGMYERDKLSDILASGDDRTRNHFQVNARYALGAHTLGAFLGKSQDWKGSAGVDDSGATMYVLGDNYALSKRTQVYAFYARLMNERNGAYVLGGSPGVTATAANTVSGVANDWTLAERNQTGVGVGIIHNF